MREFVINVLQRKLYIEQVLFFILKVVKSGNGCILSRFMGGRGRARDKSVRRKKGERVAQCGVEHVSRCHCVCTGVCVVLLEYRIWRDDGCRSASTG